MPISPDTIVQSVGGLFTKGGASMMKWFGWFFWTTLIGGVLYCFWTFLQYRIKYVYGLVGASGKYGSEQAIDLEDPNQVKEITIRGIKTDRIRVVKERGAVKWKTLFSRETFEPFEYSHIYPGNTVMGMKLGKNQHIPAVYNISNPETLVEPISRSIKFWEQVEAQQTTYDYTDFKSRMMPIFITMGTIIFCLVLVGLTVWWTTKNIGGALSTWKADIPRLEQIAAGMRPD